MKFKKMILNNFRQFKGKNEIEFSVEDDKNITVIYGGITYGKTTLLQAFNWVLYNQITLQNSSQLLNLEVQESMQLNEEKEVSVELYIDHVGDKLEEYRFRRMQNYRSDLRGQVVLTTASCCVEKRQNDIWINAGDFIEQANNVLPFNLSTYFFFDGERMDAISKEQRKGSQEVGKSVKSILGIEHYSTALKHLSNGTKTVVSELRSRINSTMNTSLEEIKKSIDDAELEIEKNVARIDEYNNEIERLEIDKTAKEKVILENKDTYKKQQDKQELQDKLDILKEKRERLYNNYFTYFNHYYLEFFYYGLNKQIKKLIDSKILSEEQEGIPEMHQISIQYLIDRGFCLCGEKIDREKKDEHYRNLIEEMKKLPPQNIGTMIYSFNNELRMKISEEKSNGFREEIINKFNEICENYDEINQVEDKIEKISLEIQSNIDVGSLERQVREIDKKIRELSEKIGVFKSNIENYKAVKQRQVQEMSIQAQYDSRNKEILKQIEYAEHIYAILQEIYKEREKQLINKLEIEINNFLSKIYTGDRKMKITSDYKFKLLYSDAMESNIDSSESEGLGTVKAISFMCGLLNVAKSEILKEVENKIMYPLVFDAPLSKIDSIHRRNVMECLPEVASQIIIFTREQKDLEDITQETKNRISAQYQIEKISEKYSRISESKREG